MLVHCCLLRHCRLNVERSGTGRRLWETRALEMARGEPGNAQMVMLGLKNRSRAPSGWHHDSQRVEHSGDMTVEHRPAFDAATLSWEDRAELRRILLLTRGKGDEAALK